MEFGAVTAGDMIVTDREGIEIGGAVRGKSIYMFSDTDDGYIRLRNTVTETKGAVLLVST